MRLSFLLIWAALLLPLPAGANLRPVEVHQVLALSAPGDNMVALTLDACGGGFDANLVRFLVAKRISATIFVTRRWFAHNPQAIAWLTSHPELFEIEDHGANHLAAVIGSNRRVYGIPGSGDLEHLRREVAVGAMAVQRATGQAPRWYRGATAAYDPQALSAIEQMGYRIAGFSVNADDGATLPKDRIVARLAHVKNGDIIIAHVNRPESDTAEGLAIGLQKLLARGVRFVTLRQAEVRLLPDTERKLSPAPNSPIHTRKPAHSL